MTEEQEFTRRIANLAQGKGLLAHWCRDSRKCYGHRGFPDLVIIGMRGVIFAEIKGPGGRLLGGQWTWRDVLLQSGQRIVIWQPSDWDTGVIEDELRAIA